MYTDPNKKSLGPLIAVIIILSLIIIGGLYFLKERASQKVYPATTTDSVTESLNKQSTSDDLNSIEKDLNNTNIDNLDQGAAAIDSQLQ
jgi:hypothetical protein